VTTPSKYSFSQNRLVAHDINYFARSKPIASRSAPISRVPPELWAIIASFSSRPTIARLCLLSRAFNTIFLPQLYTNLLDPDLTIKQSSLILKTLCLSPSALSTSHHPASLIRKLSVKDDVSTMSPEYSKAQTALAVQVLDNMRMRPLAEPQGPSLLRVLHWGLLAGVDELGRILSSPGMFPHLRELIVTSKGANKNFNVSPMLCIRAEIHLLPVHPDSRSRSFGDISLARRNR
jgi:hypothetical protein